MALIICPYCKEKISDKATVCPHCQNALSANVTTPDKKPNKTLIISIVAIAVAVMAVVAAVIVVINSNSSKNGGGNNGVPSDTYTPNASAQINEYDVKIDVFCEKNSIINKYDVDILLDGKALVTLPHGGSDSFDLRLSEGSHKLEFRIASKDVVGQPIYNPNDTNSFKVVTVNITSSQSFSFDIKLGFGNSIEVTQQSKQ